MTTHHHRSSSGQPIHPACARQIASNILRRRHKAQHQQQRPQNLPSRPPSATGSSDPGLTWSNSVSPMLIRAQPIPELVILRPQIVTRAVDHKASAAEQPEPMPRDNSANMRKEIEAEDSAGQQIATRGHTNIQFLLSRASCNN